MGSRFNKLLGKSSLLGLDGTLAELHAASPRIAREQTPGALGLGQVKATRIYCAFYIAYYVSPMLFAILSDSCRVLLAFIVFYICFDQMQNNLISQSAQMETSGTPNDMLSAMNQVGCILFTPFIHHVIYPLLHKRHIYLQPITRITIGFGFVASSMAYTTIVQNVIYSSVPCYNHPRACSSVANREPNHVNVWIQAPVFFLIAMGEVWAYVTALEIAYSHAPQNMKAMIQAIFPLMAGVGSAAAMGLTTLAHDPNLVILYAALAGGMAITTVVFWLLFHKHNSDHAGNKSDVSVGFAGTPS
ncbi:oligopeptide transporter [Paraphaeosphaeria minitans]|uniref:Oligopeptide transporter n=1 Tax=Paraphaeosphaeria minitans TaxID=565426 RepID=A0A9P6G4L3_9PLEO|nr:oligopeptide transporter [Paraphaeosphaeria minitans]